jgi:hypothetical protein
LEFVLHEVHVPECIHRLNNFHLRFKSMEVSNGPLSMVLVPNDPIVNVPYLEAHFELNRAISVELQNLLSRRQISEIVPACFAMITRIFNVEVLKVLVVFLGLKTKYLH